MQYAQKNYLQLMGRTVNGVAPRFRIDQIGCFLVSFTNLVNEGGVAIDPIGLNNIFRDRGIYTDIDDKVFDDLGWGSIGAVYPQFVLGKTANTGINRTAGWPSNNRSIVRFYYKSVQSGQMIFHFCKVADAAKHLILDSYDGKVKPSPYGEPTGWAEYAYPTPQVVVPVQPPSSVVGKQLFLPAEAGTWRVYPKNKPAVVGNEVGKLWPGNPAWAPGLLYDILGNPSTNVYTINTNTWGQVNIYAGPDTIAQFRDKVVAPSPPPTPPAPAPVTPPVSHQPEVKPVETPKVDFRSTAQKLVNTYRAKETIDVNDFAQVGVHSTLNAGNLVRSAQRFEVEGKKYIRTAKSVAENKWFGIPEENLIPANDPSDESIAPIIADIRKEDEDESIFDLSTELNELNKNLRGRERLVAIVGTVTGTALRILQAIKPSNIFKKKEVK